MLLDGKVAIVTGKVDSRDDEISFLAESMVEVKHDSTHLVTIPADTPKEKLLQLKELLEQNAGEIGVTLFFEADAKKIIAKQKVNWNEKLQAEILNILGDWAKVTFVI